MGETDQKYTGRKKTAGQKAYKEENQMEAYQNAAFSPANGKRLLKKQKPMRQIKYRNSKRLMQKTQQLRQTIR